jgi:hypothetical protein
MKGTVTTKTQYTPAQGGSLQSPETSATVEDGSAGSAQGDAGSQGNSASADNPNSEGGTDTSEAKWKMPDGAKLERATIRLTLECGPRETISLECSGNVSVSGGISGGCITCVEVSSETGGDGVTKTKTRRKKKCCAS